MSVTPLPDPGRGGGRAGCVCARGGCGPSGEACRHLRLVACLGAFEAKRDLEVVAKETQHVQQRWRSLPTRTLPQQNLRRGERPSHRQHRLVGAGWEQLRGLATSRVRKGRAAAVLQTQQLLQLRATTQRVRVPKGALRPMAVRPRELPKRKTRTADQDTTPQSQCERRELRERAATGRFRKTSGRTWSLWRGG
eukprot:scaffold967_cov321-Pavlova_lutheri.AAC.14